MPGTVDDFMQRFGGSGTVSDQDAAHYYDRFTSTHENDREFDNQTFHDSATEYLGKLPDDQFHEAARNAYMQAPPQERQGLIGGLLNALGMGGGGAAASGLAGALGLGSNDPNRMSADDYARLMNYARREKPEAVRQTVEEKPWLMRAMGHPVVMGALAVAAAKLLSRPRQ